MSCYIIGDVHGCYRELMTLLTQLDFNENEDQLFFTGDIVNRGPDSLACLRLVKQLDARTVLGNHDLHLLACFANASHQNRLDTLTEILAAPDADELIDWLRRQPLLIYSTDFIEPFCLVHAGLTPQWTVKQAQQLAQQVEMQLQSDVWRDFMQHIYGNEPNQFIDTLKGYDRWRIVINIMTRMRFLDHQFKVDFRYKGTLAKAPSVLKAWFQFPRQDFVPILFGHWAALNGQTPDARIDCQALDTGCVWQGHLTALKWPSRQRVSVAALAADSSYRSE